MLPKIQNQNNKNLKKEVITANIIQEDHVRGMKARTKNEDYKPWKSRYCPKNPHSAFGNFPKTYKINPMNSTCNRIPNYATSFSNTEMSNLIRLFRSKRNWFRRKMFIISKKKTRF